MSPLLAIIFKDVLIELRNRETVTSMMMFGFLVVVIFNFAFEPSGAERSLIAPGIIWVSFSFAGIIGLNRSLAMETDNDCLQGLLLAPLSRSDLYLGKVASNFLFMIFSEIIVLPIFFILNNVPFTTSSSGLRALRCWERWDSLRLERSFPQSRQYPDARSDAAGASDTVNHSGHHGIGQCDQRSAG
jgi:ABC-type transport system involved in cytochrome c biogenesis permease component